MLRRYGVEYRTYGQHHHVSQGWLNVDCPNCSAGSNNFRLGYNIRGKRFNCWVCGYRPLIDTLGKLLGLSRKATIEVVEGLGASERVMEAPRGRLELPAGIGKLLSAHRKYLIGRGFDPDQLTEVWKIGGIGLASKLAWRIFIPAFLNGEVVSWTTRAITDKVQSKYITAKKVQEKFPLKQMLYGEQFCSHTIIINEGPMDAWTIGPGAVATCGVSYTREQLLRMSKYPVRVIVFDNEPDAQRRARKLSDDLAVFDGDTYNVVLSGKDASRSPKREIEELRRRFL